MTLSVLWSVKENLLVNYDTYEEFRDPVTYDLECDAFTADFPLVEQWAQDLSGESGTLLDLACGTGRMSIHLAERGYQVTGIDLVPEMIAHGRSKAAAHGVSIDFHVADARDFHLGKQFPYIVMLMNAFQFLYSRADHEAMLACVREHLEPDGCFLFETRNPNSRNLDHTRHAEPETVDHPDGGTLTTSETQHYDPLTQIQHYATDYTFAKPDGQRESKTIRVGLRYVYPQELESLLHYNGFAIRTIYGDWQGNPLTLDSPAMICVCEKR